MKRTVTILLSLFFINISFASTLINDLSQCDTSFFQSAKKMRQFAPIIEDFYQQKLTDSINYTKPVNTVENGVKIVNFTVTYTDFDKYKGLIPNTPAGKYYYWGVESSQSIDEVVAILSKDIQLIKLDKNYYVYNPMYRNSPSEDWKVNSSPTGSIAPSEQEAEKLLIVENDSENNKVKIFCTLQGNLTEKDLRHAGLVK